MEFGRNLCIFFLVCLSSFLSATEGYKFYVGGRDGWVLNPSENYNHWAERNRFQVNDTLYFKYNKGTDSVLVVNKDNFFNCNTSKPLQKLEDGNSEFKFDRSGAFYFISGQDGNCAKGQKLIVIVLAVRNRQTPPASPPLAAPPRGSAPASAPSQGTAPASAPSQATAPSSAPSQGSVPAASPSHAPSTSPTTSPVPAPAAETPTSSPPSASPPVSSPSSPVGETPTPSGEAPSGNVTASPPGSNQDSTAPKGNGSYGVTASSVLVSSVIVLASLALMSTFY